MNKVILIGRVTKDIELQSTTSGTNYVQFDVAIDNGKDENGESRPAEFVNCTAWEKRAETLSVYVKKGHKVAIEGSIKTDKYQNAEGENRYRTYVLVKGFEFLESKPKDNFVPQEPDDIKKGNYTTEEIDEIPLPDDPFQGEQMTITDDMLPF